MKRSPARSLTGRVLACLLALLLCAGLLGGCSAQARWQEQYDLGMRYLNEGKYEEAILAFEAAIKIDPKNPAAYLGAGDAHLAAAALAEDEQTKREHLEKALEMYQKAQELGDETAADKVQQAQDELDKLDKGPIATSAEELPVADVSLQPLTEEHFDYLEEFRNGYAFGIQGLDCGYLDTQGNFTVYYQRADPVPFEDFDTEDFFLWQLLGEDNQQMWVSEEGLFPMYDRASGLWGYGDIHTGQMVIPAAYSDACPFSEGRAVVLQYTSVTHTDSNNNGGVVSDGQGGTPTPYISVIDTSGNVLFTGKDVFDIAYTDGTLLFVSEEADESGIRRHFINLADLNGNILAKMTVGGTGDSYSFHGTGTGYSHSDQIVRGDPDHLCVQWASGEVYYIDSTGNITARVPDGAEWGSVWVEGESVAYYSKDGKYGLFNENGPVTDPLYTNAIYFAEGVAFVSEDDTSWYLIDAQGNRLSENTYEEAGNASADGLIAVKQDGLWGYCDLTGELVIPCQFYSAFRFSDGVARVTFEEEGPYCIINTKGENVASDLTVQEWFTNEEGFYLTKQEDGWQHLYLPA